MISVHGSLKFTKNWRTKRNKSQHISWAILYILQTLITRECTNARFDMWSHTMVGRSLYIVYMTHAIQAGNRSDYLAVGLASLVQVFPNIWLV